MTKPAQLISQLLSVGADPAPALGAPGAVPMTYQALRRQVTYTVAQLNRWGIGRDDRVAMVLSNGPDMAVAFLSVACGATAAPLNPGYRADEFEFYLSDLRARAVIIEAGSASAVIGIAQKLGVAIIELTPGRPAGTFTLSSDRGAVGTLRNGGWAEPEGIALLLHTSGTTSRPKIVPLSHKNVCASATSIAANLAFTTADRGLNIMPLFHIHGLIAGILAPLSKGSYVCCSPGFDALKFFSWLDETKATWYTAVPTMHQLILTRVSRNADVIRRNPLRFLRSSSSSMPVQVIGELEAAFGAPLIESYGMTEASHQMCSNPLPPLSRKPGTVGIAAGPQVAIMGESGKLIAHGKVGEIVIKGDNVTTGYESNPSANAEAYLNGWFRTGDQGFMDVDGYVTISGRLKEIINRGGEKISPREVDEVLMDHPAILQVVTFGIPHPKLGEEVGVIAVLREAHTATEAELRAFAATRLADFKVPKTILFRAELPKGATGKLQRIGLAQKLGLGST